MYCLADVDYDVKIRLRTESGSEKVKLESIKIKRGQVPANASDFDFRPSQIHINIPHSLDQKRFVRSTVTMERKRACALRFLLPRCSGVYILDEAPLILQFSPSIFNIKHSQAPSSTLTPPQASLHFLRHHLRRHSSSGITFDITPPQATSHLIVAHHPSKHIPTPTSITLTIDRLVVASSRCRVIPVPHPHVSTSSSLCFFFFITHTIIQARYRVIVVFVSHVSISSSSLSSSI
jgi:hypothetical protein